MYWQSYHSTHKSLPQTSTAQLNWWRLINESTVEDVTELHKFFLEYFTFPAWVHWADEV
jgi:hypothetical protein